jgi:hypothetical protein
MYSQTMDTDAWSARELVEKGLAVADSATTTS